MKDQNVSIDTAIAFLDNLASFIIANASRDYPEDLITVPELYADFHELSLGQQNTIQRSSVDFSDFFKMISPPQYEGIIGSIFIERDIEEAAAEIKRLCKIHPLSDPLSDGGMADSDHVNEWVLLSLEDLDKGVIERKKILASSELTANVVPPVGAMMPQRAGAVTPLRASDSPLLINMSRAIGGSGSPLTIDEGTSLSQ